MSEVEFTCFVLVVTSALYVAQGVLLQSFILWLEGRDVSCNISGVWLP
jgi:hypothetical protein